jgi:hypothetical protein
MIAEFEYKNRRVDIDEILYNDQFRVPEADKVGLLYDSALIFQVLRVCMFDNGNGGIDLCALIRYENDFCRLVSVDYANQNHSDLMMEYNFM